MESTLKIASMNCRGLGEFTKRRDVFHFLREKNFSLYLLQDTHFTSGIEERIKREWGYDAYFSSFASNSRGVAILINNNIQYKLLDFTKDLGGNYIILRIEAFDTKFVIVNIYGPNDDQPDFYINLEQNIIRTSGETDNIIIAGDFNLVMNFDLDYCNYVRRNNVEAREKVLDMMDNLDLIDIFRELNPDLRRFTWRRSTPFQQSRLDFFLISDTLAPLVRNSDILPGYKSDHSIITLSLQFGIEEKRQTFWKFNASLLSDINYLSEINTVISEVTAEYSALPYNSHNLDKIPISDLQLTISDQLFLDVLLMKIRSKTISYSAFKQKENKKKEETLLKEIEQIEKNETLLTEDQETLKSKRNELSEIREHKLRGVLLRSRARWVEDGEKVSSYFCSLEKRNFLNKSINKLTVNNDVTITDKKDIIAEVKNFYKYLYSRREVEDVEIADLVQNLPKLNDQQSNNLEGELTLEEISLSLKEMKNGKSPGSDGFGVEFFKLFWKKLGGFVLRSLNEGFRKGELSNTQKEAVIICIPKTDKERDKIKNLRPISLLNIVYKIGSSSIANRIKTVLPEIINEDQTGFMKNRCINDNIRLIYDIISFLNSTDKPGMILCLDFEKAFDSVDWGFLSKVLLAFGFKRDILKWIETFNTNIRSTVSVNGMISDWFSIERGCRQGDPISPYLFIICAEIMSTMIRENDRIRGININDTECKLTQYADDSELLLEGDRDSFEESIQTVQCFGKVSGLVLNHKKTNAVSLGSLRNRNIQYMQHLNIAWDPPVFKILGISFTNDLHDIIELNFRSKINEVQSLYRIWIKRQVTPLGRIAVLKSLVLSKLIFLWILLPNPPDDMINDIQLTLYKFIWNNKIDRISRETATKALKDGGLSIPNITKYIQALKITWIRRLYNSNHKWKKVFLDAFPLAKDINKIGTDLPMNGCNAFWSDVIRSYKEFGRFISVDSTNSFIAEPIFYNVNFKIGNQPFFYEDWFEKGVSRVKHFIDNDGNFLSFDEFKMKHNIVGNNFLRYAGCIDVIKKYKRKCDLILEDNLDNEENDIVKTITFSYKGAKYFYDILNLSQKRPNYCLKWEEKLEMDINWKLVFLHINHVKEIKLRWFEIRTLSRILGTNVTLLAMGIKTEDTCTFCNEEKESIEHLFCECDLVLTFWAYIKKLLVDNNIVQNEFILDHKLILFGYSENHIISKQLSYFLVLCKYFIYRCRCEETIPLVLPFVNYFRIKHQTNRFIALKNCKIEKFNENWELWKNIIG